MKPILQSLFHPRKARASSTSSGKAKTPRRSTWTRHHAAPSSGSTLSVVNSNRPPTSSPWDVLPVELEIKIFAHCGVRDILRLKLVCKSFLRLISSNEHSIAREYLRQRRHGTLPSEDDNERTYSTNSEDDVVILSDLYPPSKSAKGGFIYTFRYIHSLRRRQDLCLQLAYYLAERVVDRLSRSRAAPLKTMFPSKNQRNDFLKRTTVQFRFRITPPIYYIQYFLETYRLARRELTNRLVRDFEEKRLPVRIRPEDRKKMYADLQAEIMRTPPFTDDYTFLSTNHCLFMLVQYMQWTIPPDESPQDDSWIGSLLSVSPFTRIIEYFSAEIGDGGGQRMQRKDFMRNFHNDIKLSEQDEMDALVFERAPNTHLHSSVQDVWFDVAKREMVARVKSRHEAERILTDEGVPIVLSCDGCEEAEGWHA